MTAKGFLTIKEDSTNWSIEQVMIEFAKYHVTLALASASKKAEAYSIDEVGQIIYTDAKISKESILNSYSLENIK